MRHRFLGLQRQIAAVMGQQGFVLGRSGHGQEMVALVKNSRHS
jgi:hypothetical protein